MIMHRAVAFLLFAIVAAVTPGPSNTMLTAVGAGANPELSRIRSMARTLLRRR